MHWLKTAYPCMLSNPVYNPAGIATWKKEMSLLATQISPHLRRLFDGTARIDCLPKPPQTTDTFCIEIVRSIYWNSLRPILGLSGFPQSYFKR